MARNDSRRTELADAAIAVLAAEGARGLTHRAVDQRAGVPAGTTSNYFRSRAALLEGLVARIGERFAPEPEVLASLAADPPDHASYVRHVRDIARRLLRDRDVTLAWFELRLEAARRPEVASLMERVLVTGFEADVAYNTAAGLPGGAREIALFHYALDGLVLDRLTVSIDPGTDVGEVVEAFVTGLLP